MTVEQCQDLDPEELGVDDASLALHAKVRRIDAAGSVDLPIAAALDLLFDPLADPAERRAVLMRQDLPRKDIIRATQTDEPGVRAFAVGLTRTPLEIVVSAASDEAWQVRAEAARHRSCPPQTLALLARDGDAVVRRAALAHPMIPSAVLIDVLTHGRSRLDAEVAGGNGGFSVAPHVDELMDVTSFGAQALMKRGSLPPGLVGRFTRPDHIEAVRVAAVRFPQCPVEELARVAQVDASADVRAVAAEQPGCPLEALASAAHDASARVRRRVAENPSTPGEGIDVLLADPDESVRLRAARHPAASPLLLAMAARTDENTKVRLAALRNDSCPAEVLDDLCADPELVLVAARHASCTPAGLFVALLTIRDMPRTPPAGTSDDDPRARKCREVRAVVGAARKRLAPRTWAWLAGNPLQDVHPEDLQRLLSRHLAAAAVDPRPGVRIGVAHHPDVDDATLTMLASDEDEQVRAAVSERILDVALGGRTTRR